MTCNACEKAQENARTGLYEASCVECWCRAMAQSPAAHRALGGQPEELQGLLRTKFTNPTAYHAARLKVWEWIRKFDPKD